MVLRRELNCGEMKKRELNYKGDQFRKALMLTEQNTFKVLKPRGYTGVLECNSCITLVGIICSLS